MLTFVMLTRLSPGALDSPRSLEELEHQVRVEIQNDCPGVEWVHNYAILGDCDYLDIFKAPDMETALKVATIVRTFGHGRTEIWTATEWGAYKDIVRNLPEHAVMEPEPAAKDFGAHPESQVAAEERERVRSEHHRHGRGPGGGMGPGGGPGGGRGGGRH